MEKLAENNRRNVFLFYEWIAKWRKAEDFFEMSRKVINQRILYFVADKLADCINLLITGNLCCVLFNFGLILRLSGDNN